MVRCSSAVAERSSGAGTNCAGQYSPSSSGGAQGVLLGCWLAPIVHGDGGDGCQSRVCYTEGCDSHTKAGIR